VTPPFVMYIVFVLHIVFDDLVPLASGTKNAKTRLVAYHLAPKYGPKTKHYLSDYILGSYSYSRMLRVYHVLRENATSHSRELYSMFSFMHV